MIDLKTFNNRINKTFSPAIRELGFKGSSGHYRRKMKDNLINCIVLQKNRYGKSFTIELGVHFDFMPNTLNNIIPLNKFTTYDCEFRKRLSPIGKDYWWDYGCTINQSDIILLEVVELIKHKGKDYFELFANYTDSFGRYMLQDVIGNHNLRRQYGDITEIRMILAMARINVFIGNNSNAKDFIDWGIENCKEGSKVQDAFRKLQSENQCIEVISVE